MFWKKKRNLVIIFKLQIKKNLNFYKGIDIIILNIYLYVSEIYIIWKYFMIEIPI